MGSNLGDQPYKNNMLMNNEKSGGSSSSSNNSNPNSSSKNNNSKGKNNTTTKSGGGGGGVSGGGHGGSNSSEKPKQPQRGLGVAQLEKIRLHTQMASCGFLPHHLPPPHGPFQSPPPPFQHVQEDMIRMQGGYHHQAPMHPPYGYPVPPMGSPSPYGYHPGFMMQGMGDPSMERPSNIVRYAESQPPCTTARWNPNTNVYRLPILESQHCAPPPGMVTRHLLSHVEQNNGRNSLQHEPVGASISSHIPEPKEEEELDLELKL